MSLRYLAKGELFSEVGDIHGVSRSSVSRILASFIDSINVNVDNIRFPTDLMDMKLSFYKKCGLPNVVGVVDGTLIPIIAPIDHEEIYVCRKGYHALNIQAVVDHDMRFIDVVSKWPGSTHDASIFDGCGLKEYLANNYVGHLLGDSGYPLREYIMTPFLRPTTGAEIQYNAAHNKGRIIIERSFGVLKSRFRCLHKTGGCLPFSPGKCGKIVTACMRLHNLCRERGIPLVTNEVLDDDDGNIHPSQACDGSGQRKRQELLRLFERN